MTVSAQIDFESRLLFRDTLKPVYKIKERNDVKILDEYKFLCEKQIDSPQELVSFISETREQISVLEKERQSVYNRNRHKKSEELNAQAREISTKIKTMRKELSTAKAIFEKIPRFEKLLETERQMENAVAIRCKESLQIKSQVRNRT